MKRYPVYKKSGIDWIGQIPEQWNMNKIGRMMFLERGRVISNLEIQDNLGEYPVFSSQTSDQGMLGRINTYDYEGKYLTWTTNGNNAGTVFSRTGKFNCTNVCGAMKPLSQDTCLPYFAYLLSIGTKYYTRNDTNPNLTIGAMADISVCSPSNAEQHTIVNFLDKTTTLNDDLISKKQRQIELLKEQRQVVVNQAVTKGLNPNIKMKGSGIKWVGKIPEHWKAPELKWVIQSVSNGSVAPQIADSNYPVSRIETISTGEIDFDKVGYIASEDVQENFILKRGDILLSHVNSLEYIGNCALYDSHRLLVHGIHVLRIIPGDKIIPKYLLYILKSHWFRHCERAISKRSICQVSITSTDLTALKICLPPYKEQQAIIKYLDKNLLLIDSSIQKAEQQIHLLQEYRTALISEAATGKIDVRGWAS
jgi:type I restriction enzyme S subunit